MKRFNHLSLPSIGILTVATNIYVEYWKKLVKSCRLFLDNSNISLYVFTDQKSEVDRFRREIKMENIVSFSIPEYQWPEATLFRYEIYNKYFPYINSEIVMHLDADSLVVNEPWPAIRSEARKGVSLVAHPGYWRPKGIEKVFRYSRKPNILVKDFYHKFSNGGLGTWEKDTRSSAFTPRRLRKNYVCGGTWFGYKNAINEMTEELASNVRLDLDRGLTAVWHDESHLNYWASRNEFNLCGPEFCFDQTYSDVPKNKPLILAIRKEVMTR